MKKFIKKLLLFSVPLFILLFSAEVYLYNMKTSYSEKIDGLIQNKDKIELLVLGNSHEAYGINPNKFDCYSYNLAHVNQSLYFDKRIILKHIDRLPNLKYVLIGVDFHSLYFSDQGIRNIWSYYAHGIDYKNDLPVSTKYSRVKGYTLGVILSFLKKKISGKYDKIGVLDLENDVNLNAPMQKGWFFYNGVNANQMNTTSYLNRANEFNTTVKKSIIQNEVQKDLEDFIIILKNKKITPILIATPCYSEFRENISKEFRLKNEIIINNITKKYNIQYWDFFELPLKKSYFYNCDHLNYQGATFFTEIINDKLKKSLQLH